MAVMAPETPLRVSELLKERQMSASELMRRADIAWSTAQALAAGKPLNLTLETMEKVAGALGVKVKDLFAKEK